MPMTIRMTAIRERSSSTATSSTEPNSGASIWVRISVLSAHYTQFLVYDFDGDGKAEMVCKTSAGSVDARGRFVSDAATDDGIRSIDNHADYRNSRGRIMTVLNC